MADERLERIKTAIIDHGRWLRRKGGRRADLSFQDLSSLDLDRIDLTGAKFTGANLARVSLKGAKLVEADLFGADLELADLTGADLTSADLRGANMNRCVLADANMRGADFRPGEVARGDGVDGVIGGQTSLVEAKMERSILIGANLAGCDLTGADLVDADLSGAELSQSIMIGVDLDGANLDGATIRDTVADVHTLARVMKGTLPPGAVAEPPYRPLSGEAFLAAVTGHEEWADSDGARGARLDLDTVSVPAVDLTDRRLLGARLRRCRFDGGDWSGVDLRMVDMSYGRLAGVGLRGALLSGANLRRADLKGADLSGARCEPFPFAGGRSWPTNFDGADMTGAKLDGANMEGIIPPRARTDAAPAAPPSGAERRRHARYQTPELEVIINGQPLRTINWSIGGMSLDGGTEFRLGDRLAGSVTIKGHDSGPDAEATMVVVYMNRAKGQMSVRFDGYGQNLKVLLKQAFSVNQRG